MPKSVLVLLPGTLCDSRLFTRQARSLRPYARVISASYAGLRELDSWLTRLLRQLPARFSVAGFSLGGLIALELLRRAPERIERLALIASNAQAGSVSGVRRSAWLRRLWLERGPSEVARHIKPGYFHHEAKRRAYQRLVMDMALATSQRAAFAQFDWAAKRPPGMAAVHTFSGPLLAVSGANDRLVPRAWQQALCAAQPHTQWCELPHCGHFVPLEAPAQLSRALIQWMNRPPAH
jgi:pimeloyl-ACP methyl ester carboxylesterase